MKLCRWLRAGQPELLEIRFEDAPDRIELRRIQVLTTRIVAVHPQIQCKRALGIASDCRSQSANLARRQLVRPEGTEYATIGDARNQLDARQATLRKVPAPAAAPIPTSASGILAALPRLTATKFA